MTANDMKEQDVAGRVLGRLAQQIMAGWEERRRDRVIARFMWVEGSTITKAVVPTHELTQEVFANSRPDPDLLLQVLGRLSREGLLLPLTAAGKEGYVLTPLGFWMATQGTTAHGEEPAGPLACVDAGVRNEHTARDQVLELITEALHLRWVQAARSEKIETVTMQPQYASFLLFLLVGGAVGASQPLRWSKHRVHSAETARDLLRALCLELGWPRGVEIWGRNEELSNFVRRPQLRQLFGKSFKKVDDVKRSESVLYFEVESDVEALTQLLRPVVRCFSGEAVVATLTGLDRQPWAKDPRFVSQLASIRSLFGRHLCPPLYRRQLVQAGERAAAELAAESNVTDTDRFPDPVPTSAGALV